MIIETIHLNTDSDCVYVPVLHHLDTLSQCYLEICRQGAIVAVKNTGCGHMSQIVSAAGHCPVIGGYIVMWPDAVMWLV